MAHIEKFEDIVAWQESRKLVAEVYKVFSEIKDFDFRSQIRRAVLSIPNNIAEGFAYRNSKDFARYLRYAYGSASEVKSMIYLAIDLKLIDEEKAVTIFDSCNKVSFLIWRLKESKK